MRSTAVPGGRSTATRCSTGSSGRSTYLQPEPQGRRKPISARPRRDRRRSAGRLFVPDARFQRLRRRALRSSFGNNGFGGGVRRWRAGGNISNQFQTTCSTPSWVPGPCGARCAASSPATASPPPRPAPRAAERKAPVSGAGLARQRLSAAARLRRTRPAACRRGQGVHPGAADRQEPVQGRHHRPVGGRPGAGAARRHARAADRGRSDPRPARTFDRGADRQAAGGTDDQAAVETAAIAISGALRSRRRAFTTR